MKRVKISVLFFLILTAVIFAEEETEFEFFPGEEFKITEKQDLRMRVNGRYKGFIYRETRTSLKREDWDDAGTEYSGYVYVFQEMKRDTRLLARRIEDSAPFEVKFTYNGDYIMDDSLYTPALRGVPNFPAEPVLPGESWRASGERIVKAEGDSPYTRIPVYCEYRYEGIRNGGGGEYHSIKAQYAVRYRGEDSTGDPNLANLDGSHRVDIRIPVDEPEKIFMRDQVEEQYRMRTGDMITYSGVILTWFDAPVDFNSRNVEEDVVRLFGNDDEEEERFEKEKGVDIRREEEGFVLSIPDIHFVPNSAEILADEKSRLDGVAEILKDIQDITFLVRGHTADLGMPENQLLLSEERAVTIIEEMKSRGIPENRFIYEGKGGSMPLASNESEEGRKKNRRVEIILLE